MDTKSLLYRRTLLAGIIVGLIGILIMLFSNVFMQNIGTMAFTGSNGFFYALTQIYMIAPVVCMPFSAALVSAAIVMRYLTPQSVRKSDQQPTDEISP